MKCMRCQGTGNFLYMSIWSGAHDHDCKHCKGTGKVGLLRKIKQLIMFNTKYRKMYKNIKEFQENPEKTKKRIWGR